MFKITVLMPVYNGEAYIREAIESILNQTFKDFEFLVIDDGSTDKSADIIKSYKDNRIRFVRNETNLGLIKTLNKGIDMANGEYIARMDDDDISLPKRLGKQRDFMQKNPEIGIVGSWIKLIGEQGRQGGRVIKYLSNPEEIKANLLFLTSLIHPSIMMRKNLIKENNLYYNSGYKHAEDYELWVRASKYFPISNIKEVLLLHRKYRKSVSETNSTAQKEKAEIIRIQQIKSLSINPSKEELLIHQSIDKPQHYSIVDFIAKEESWLQKLINQNRKINHYTEPHFSKVISRRWLTVCSANANYGFFTWNAFWQSPLRKNIRIKEWKALIKFFIKCILRKRRLRFFVPRDGFS